MSNQLSQDFIAFSIEKQVLKFGEFKTKAGRLSPYFFNAGLFNDGDSLLKLGEFYADSIESSGIEFDMLFGPAYKGIPLVAAISIAFARRGTNCIRESVDIIKVNGGTPSGVSIAIDRQERGTGQLSAVQEVTQNYQLPVISIAKLANLLEFVKNDEELEQYLLKITRYQQEYCS